MSSYKYEYNEEDRESLVNNAEFMGDTLNKSTWKIKHVDNYTRNHTKTDLTNSYRLHNAYQVAK